MGVGIPRRKTSVYGHRYGVAGTNSTNNFLELPLERQTGRTKTSAYATFMSAKVRTPNFSARKAPPKYIHFFLIPRKQYPWQRKKKGSDSCARISKRQPNANCRTPSPPPKKNIPVIYLRLFRYFSSYFKYISGPRVAQWFRRCATGRTVPGSIPGVFTGFFSDIFPSDRTMTMGSSSPSENEYQEHS
jgi:hypothetical protein